MSERAGVDEVFNDIVGALDYPMVVVTASAAGERAGCLVGFAAQCSIGPPRFMIWLSKRNHTFRVAEQASVLAVHVLSSHDIGLAELFGGQTGDEVDKFAACRWRPGPGGAPILLDCTRWFAGEVLERVDTGDHVGFLLAPFEAEGGSWSSQLGFQRARAIDPGHDA